MKRFFMLLTVMVLVTAVFAATPTFAAEPAIDYGIDFTRESYIIPCNEDPNIYINLDEEKLYIPKNLVIEGISFNGGAKWEITSIDATGLDLVKRFNKSVSIRLSTSLVKKRPIVKEELDESGNVITPVSTIYTFPTIAARPKIPSFMINYGVFADNTGATNGKWTLTSKGGKTTLPGFQIAHSDDKKTPDDGNWGKFPTESGALSGLPVFDLDDAGKVVKNIYLIRVGPDMEKLQPASKPKKITVTSVNRATTFKADYKAEIIKTKDLARSFLGSANQLASNTNVELVTVYNKTTAKTGLKISELMGEPIQFWLAATDKKAATSKQNYTPSRRGVFLEKAPTFTTTSVKMDTTIYEVKNPTKGTFSTTIPKVTASITHEIRKKSTAKAGKEDDTMFSASLSGQLVITYGLLPNETTKSGILDAYIVAPETKGIIRAYAEDPVKLTAVEAQAEKLNIKFRINGFHNIDDLEMSAVENPDKVTISPVIKYASTNTEKDSATLTDLVLTKNAEDGTATIEYKLSPEMPCTATVLLDIKVGANLKSASTVTYPEDGKYMSALVTNNRTYNVVVNSVGDPQTLTTLNLNDSMIDYTAKISKSAKSGASPIRAKSEAGELIISTDNSAVVFLNTGLENYTLSYAATNSDVPTVTKDTFDPDNFDDTVDLKNGGTLCVKATHATENTVLYFVFAVKDKIGPTIVSVTGNTTSLQVAFSEKVTMTDPAADHLYAQNMTTGERTTLLYSSSSENVVTVGGITLTSDSYSIYYNGATIKDAAGNLAPISSGSFGGSPIVSSISFANGKSGPFIMANPIDMSKQYPSFVTDPICYVPLDRDSTGKITIKAPQGITDVKYYITASAIATPTSFPNDLSDSGNEIKNLASGRYIYMQVTTSAGTAVYGFCIAKATAFAADTTNPTFTSASMAKNGSEYTVTILTSESIIRSGLTVPASAFGFDRSGITASKIAISDNKIVLTLVDNDNGSKLRDITKGVSFNFTYATHPCFGFVDAAGLRLTAVLVAKPINTTAMPTTAPSP